MPLPWLIGAAAVAAVAALASSSDDDEREERARREERRIEREAAEQRQVALREQQAREAAQKHEQVQNFANQQAQLLLEKFELSGVSANQLTGVAMSGNSDSAEKSAVTALLVSKPYQALQNSQKEAKRDLSQVSSLLQSL